MSDRARTPSEPADATIPPHETEDSAAEADVRSNGFSTSGGEAGFVPTIIREGDGPAEEAEG